MHEVREIPEAYRQYAEGATTMEELFNKLLMIMADNLSNLCSEVLDHNPTVSFLKRVCRDREPFKE